MANINGFDIIAERKVSSADERIIMGHKDNPYVPSGHEYVVARIGGPASQAREWHAGDYSYRIQAAVSDFRRRARLASDDAI